MSIEKAVKSMRPRKLKPAPPPPERKQATIYAFRRFTWILSHAVYGAAYGDPKGYDRFLPAEMSDEALGRAARAALSASRFITPDHPEWAELMRFPTKEEDKAEDDRLKAQAGVKTIKALYSGAASVRLRLQNGVIKINASRYRGSGHWEGIPGAEPVELPQLVSDAELGAAIREGLAISGAAGPSG
jgi:CDI immunity protein